MAAGGGEDDRLSALPDAMLTSILSHLRTDEAVRTSVLSRRWRRVYADVPVVDVADPEPGEHGLDKRVSFSDILAGALLARCGAAPIARLRLRSATIPRRTTCDLCVHLALMSSPGAEEVDVALGGWWRRVELDDGQRVCPSAGLLDDATAVFLNPRLFYRMPREVSRHAALRRLRLECCAVDAPGGAMALGALETLSLRRIADDGALKRLVLSCPRLVELAVEECPTVQEIVFSGDRLRRFTLRCCHRINRLAIDAPGLRQLQYEGEVPDASFFSLPIHPHVSSLEIGICERLDGDNDAASIARISELIARRSNHLNSLSLSSRPAMMFCGLQLSATLPGLKHLELKGQMGDDRALRAVVGALDRAPNLESLAICFMPVDDLKGRSRGRREGDQVDDGMAIDRDIVYVPEDLWRRPIRCLRSQLKRISLEQLQGGLVERKLAKFLLAKATCLLELSVTLFVDRCDKDGMMRELSSWRVSRQARVCFSELK